MNNERKGPQRPRLTIVETGPSVEPSQEAFAAAWALLGWACHDKDKTGIDHVCSLDPEVWPDKDTHAVAAAVCELVDEGNTGGLWLYDVPTRAARHGLSMGIASFSDAVAPEHWEKATSTHRLVDTLKADYSRRLRIDRTRLLARMAESDIPPEEWRVLVGDTDLTEGLPEPTPYLKPLTNLYELAAIPMKWAFRETIPSGVVTVLCSPGGVGKSRFMIGLALSSVLGREVFPSFHPDRSGPVVLLSAEDDRAHVARTIVGYCADHHLSRDEVEEACGVRLLVRDEAPDDLIVVDRKTGQMKRTGAYKTLRDQCAKVKPALVIVDTMSRHIGSLNENVNTEVSVLIRAFEDIAKDTDAAVVILHHENKAAFNRARNDGPKPPPDMGAVRGATVITGNIRCLWQMDKVSDDVLKVYNTKLSGFRKHTPVALRFLQSGSLKEISEEEADQCQDAPKKAKGQGWRDPLALAETIRQYLAANPNRDINVTVLCLRNGVDGKHAYDFLQKRYGDCSREVLKEAVEMGLNKRVLSTEERRTKKGDLSTFLVPGTPVQSDFEDDESEVF